MSGTILIIDAVATNRIVLKVKLSAAHFEVAQAASARDALAMISRLRPDMIVANTALPDMSCAALIAAIRALSDVAATPIVLMLTEDTPAGRVAALQAGADDVIAQPLDERIMLARMRGLLRQHHALEDMRLNAGHGPTGPDCAAGFAETQAGFTRTGQIAILGGSMAETMSLRTRLRAACPHHIAALDSARGVGAAHRTTPVDLYVLLVPDGHRELGLKLMAELRATPQARHTRIMAITPPGDSALAATLLDMGANDVIPAQPDLDELALRVQNQLGRKRLLDALRDRLHDGLRAAMIDPLTGLYNRRFALPFLRDLVAPRQTGADSATATAPRGFAVMVADLDHFKRINDHLGHAAGDAVLKHVADLLRSALRETDLIARIGGEEFLIVIPGTDPETARRTAARLCNLVARAQIPLRKDAPPAHVTISIGLTMGQSDIDTPPGEDRVEALLDQADRALYGAKARGRNTVTVSTRTAA